MTEPARQSTNDPASALTTTTTTAAKNKKNPYAKPGLTTVIGVESLNTSQMNALKGSKSIRRIMKMTKRNNSRLKNLTISTLPMSMKNL